MLDVSLGRTKNCCSPGRTTFSRVSALSWTLLVLATVWTGWTGRFCSRHCNDMVIAEKLEFDLLIPRAMKNFTVFHNHHEWDWWAYCYCWAQTLKVYLCISFMLGIAIIFTIFLLLCIFDFMKQSCLLKVAVPLQHLETTCILKEMLVVGSVLLWFFFDISSLGSWRSLVLIMSWSSASKLCSCWICWWPRFG